LDRLWHVTTSSAVKRKDVYSTEHGDCTLTPNNLVDKKKQEVYVKNEGNALRYELI
jgi:hypothetical protein